ncbi:MAG: type II secretion system protein [Opitutales bacterium]
MKQRRFPEKRGLSALRRRIRRAFTLVEVLFALTVFGLASVVLMEATRLGLFSLEIVRETRDYDEDFRFVLRQILNIAEREDFEDGGEIETLGGGEADWEVELEETNIIDLFKVELTVTFSDSGPSFTSTQSEPYTATLYVLRPGWMEEQDFESLLEDKREALEDARPWQSP